MNTNLIWYMNLPIRKFNILKKSRDYPFNWENKIYNIKKTEY